MAVASGPLAALRAGRRARRRPRRVMRCHVWSGYHHPGHHGEHRRPGRPADLALGTPHRGRPRGGDRAQRVRGWDGLLRSQRPPPPAGQALGPRRTRSVHAKLPDQLPRAGRRPRPQHPRHRPHHRRQRQPARVRRAALRRHGA